MALPNPSQIEQFSLPRNLLCLALNTTSVSNSKRAKLDHVTVDADKKRLRLAKKLFESPELEAITACDKAIRKHLTSLYAIASPLQADGTYMLQRSCYDEVNQLLQDYQIQREELVRQFVDQYPARCRESASALGVLYDPRDFPSQSDLHEKFSVSWVWFSLSAPVDMEGEASRIRSLYNEVLEGAKAELRERLLGALRHLTDRLRVGEDGKPMVFHNTLIPNVMEVLDSVGNLNFTNSSELSQAASQARQLLASVNTGQLRTDMALRSDIREQVEQLVASMDSQMVPKTRVRRLDFSV